jgi:Helix-turn-helix domain
MAQPERASGVGRDASPCRSAVPDDRSNGLSSGARAGFGHDEPSRRTKRAPGTSPVVDVRAFHRSSNGSKLRSARGSPRFEAVFGLTPHQSRIHARLDAARQLLATGRYSVTEVCMDVGFSSLGGFSALFTRRVGETPSAYRRRTRATVQVAGSVAGPPTPGCLSLMAFLPPRTETPPGRNFREA